MARSAQLQKQWTLFEQQEYEVAFNETLAMLEKLQGDDLRDAQRLLGQCCYQWQRYQQASFWFRKACQGSEQSSDWLNLAISATMQGDIQLGAETFAQVRLCQQVDKYRQQPSFYLQLYWYALALCNKGEHTHLQPLLDELAGIYKRLYNTDTAFLYNRGLPFLSSTLTLAVRHFRAQGKPAEGTAWLLSLAEGLDPDGQRQVNQAVKELQDEDGQ